MKEKKGVEKRLQYSRKYWQIKAIKKYCEIVIKKETKRLTRDEWIQVGKATQRWVIDDKIAYIRARKTIMSNQEIVNQTLINMLLQADISPERGFNLLKEAENIAKENKNSGDLIKIADRYLELHGLAPQKARIIVKETRDTVDYSNLLPSKVKKSITLTTETSGKNLENGRFSRQNTNEGLENSEKTQPEDQETEETEETDDQKPENKEE